MSVRNVLEPMGRLFYVVSPNQTSFEKLTEVPSYTKEAVPYLMVLFFIEICISLYTRKSNYRLNDTITCLSNGILMEMFRLFAPGGQLVTYFYIYKNYRLIDLPWNSIWLWWLTFFLYDFCYYWGHRAVHKIHFLWAVHIAHHSGEYFNMSLQARQSVLQHFYLWVLNLPVALFVPLPMFFVHAQFSYLYQFWVHTELIKSLGPLEYVLNTPSHHRVHHGRKGKCIDKNFGATLIIWDRLFGTFEPEKEKVVFGMTTPLNSFDLFKIQFDYCFTLWNGFRTQRGIKNKLLYLIKGSGRSPVKHWPGNIKNAPGVKAPVKKYDVPLPLWCKIYVVCQFLILLQGHLTLMDSHRKFPRTAFYGTVFYEVFSLACIGFLLDKRSNFPKIETVRCVLLFVLDYAFLQSTSFSLSLIHARWLPQSLIQFFFLASACIWMSVCVMDGIFKERKMLAFASNGEIKKIN